MSKWLLPFLCRARQNRDSVEVDRFLAFSAPVLFSDCIFKEFTNDIHMHPSLCESVYMQQEIDRQNKCSTITYNYKRLAWNKYKNQLIKLQIYKNTNTVPSPLANQAMQHESNHYKKLTIAIPGAYPPAGAKEFATTEYEVELDACCYVHKENHQEEYHEGSYHQKHCSKAA